jgi:hypothetical protein
LKLPGFWAKTGVAKKFIIEKPIKAQPPANGIFIVLFNAQVLENENIFPIFCIWRNYPVLQQGSGRNPAGNGASFLD